MTKPCKLCFPSPVLDQHMVMLGKTGSGKSSAMRHIVEHLLAAGKRVCVLDPKGDWWGIKYSADGKHPGFPIVAFGDFKNAAAQNVPINEHSGKQVAELIATGNRPALIGFRGWMPGRMHQFWIDFAATLFNRNAGELYFVGDEFHNFAPKGKVLSPEIGKCLHWSNRLLSEGRGLGIVCLLASQRPQKVHNDTLTSCETLAAMRVVHAADRKAVKDWIDGCGDGESGKSVLDSLAGMARGEAFIWSPEVRFGPQRVKFPLFVTFDSFAPPQLQKQVVQASWDDVDLDEVREKLAAVIEQEKANDPTLLRRQIADLQRDLRNAQAETVGPSSADLDAARSEGFGAGQQDMRDRCQTLFDQVRQQLATMIEGVRFELPQIEKSTPGTGVSRQSAGITTGKPASGRTPSGASEKRRHNPALPPATAAPSTVRASSDVDLDWLQPAHTRILDALAWLESQGKRNWKRSIVAAVAGASPRSSSFGNNVSKLRTSGLIDYPANGDLALTDAGRHLANMPSKPLSLQSLHEAWRSCQALQPAHIRLLDALIKSYPGMLSRIELAEQAGASATSSSFGNNVSRLSSMDLACYPMTGYVKAGPMLFPEGLR